ncbi:unnamed protein product [Miscanthus lutarioriparius]|uniref:Uncharacterized protein n=1 Tax=Miscanthus lutarioriparius TaxID=422564 RepID=A0A811MK10_9POAL|nr:unnamed protein product [Miscanthus lutarioriparius]
MPTPPWLLHGLPRCLPALPADAGSLLLPLHAAAHYPLPSRIPHPAAALSAATTAGQVLMSSSVPSPGLCQEDSARRRPGRGKVLALARFGKEPRRQPGWGGGAQQDKGAAGVAACLRAAMYRLQQLLVRQAGGRARAGRGRGKRPEAHAAVACSQASSRMWRAGGGSCAVACSRASSRAAGGPADAYNKRVAGRMYGGGWLAGLRQARGRVYMCGGRTDANRCPISLW